MLTIHDKNWYTGMDFIYLAFSFKHIYNLEMMVYIKKNIRVLLPLFTIITLSVGLNGYQYYKYNNLNSNIKTYLEADGRECNKDVETCLDELSEKLETKSGPDCSPISDTVCPDWCAAGSDYDCCIDKGSEWIQGRGCYSK